MQFISLNNFAALVGTSNATVQKWADNGIYPLRVENGVKGFYLEELDTRIKRVGLVVQKNPSTISSQPFLGLPYARQGTERGWLHAWHRGFWEGRTLGFQELCVTSTSFPSTSGMINFRNVKVGC